jgi:hypothetical protein
MTTTGQDITIYAGDGAVPVFAIQDGSGAPVDLSNGPTIEWVLARDLAAIPVLTKTIGNGVTILPDGTSPPTTGKSGRFSVTITGTDTAPLRGNYLHRARVTSLTDMPMTVTLGRFIVPGALLATYSGDPAISDRDAIRFTIQDTDSADWQFSDPEIDFALAQSGNALAAAIKLCQTLVARYARRVDKSVGDLRLSFSQRVQHYHDLIAVLRQELATTGELQIIVGGTSRSEMDAISQDRDRVANTARMGRFDLGNDSSPWDDPDENRTDQS